MEHLGNFDYFLDLCTNGPFPTLQLTFMKFPLFLQMREEIGGQLTKILWNIPDISRRSTQAKVPKPC